MSTPWWHKKKNQGITKVSRIYRLGTMNICTNFYAIHPLDVEIFHCISENFNLLVALQEKSEDH